MTKDEMVGWHHQLNGQEFEQTLGNGERQPGVLQSMGSQSQSRLRVTATEACRILIPWPEMEPFLWKFRVLTTGPPGKPVYSSSVHSPKHLLYLNQVRPSRSPAVKRHDMTGNTSVFKG